MASRKRIGLHVALAAGALIAALGTASCDSDGPTETTVGVSLTQFQVTLDRASAPRGRITFDVTNNGTVDHELVVIDTDLAPNALPTLPDGSYQENGAGTVVVAEIAMLAPGQRGQLTLDLAAGSYVLICNMVIGGNSHYAAGMRAGFTVD